MTSGKATCRTLTGIKEGFKTVVCESFDAHGQAGLCILKIDLFAHMVQDMDRSGSQRAADSYPLERYNVHTEAAYSHTSMFQSSGMDKMARATERQSTLKDVEGHGRASKAQPGSDLK